MAARRAPSGSLSSITRGSLVAADGGQGVGGHGGGDHAVEGGPGGGEGVPGGADAFGGGVEDHAEAVVGGDAGGAGVDAGEELVGEGGDDEQRGAGAAEAEVAGGEVGPVAEVAGGFAYAFRRCVSETRPRHLSPRTRETVAWETPAAGRRPGWWAAAAAGCVPCHCASAAGAVRVVRGWTRGQAHMVRMTTRRYT